ncbi:MAG: LamG domain-containing protein, partial [Rhodospirillales bacterium]|nr:LamG domain-containing protein [Rhodospirillales bacterium]
FGGWTHVAGTYTPPDFESESSGVQKLYVNGQLVGQDPTYQLPETNFANLFLGRADLSGDVEFPETIFHLGVLDEVRIWNTARTAEEIADTFNRTVDADTPGLVGYWNFDEALDDQNVFDLTASGNDGTLGAGTAVASDDPERIASTAPLVGNLEECPFDFEELSAVCAGADLVVFYSDQPAFRIGPAPCTCPGVTFERCSPENTAAVPCFPEDNEVFSSTVLEIVTTDTNPICKKVCYDIDGMRVCEKICR